jgi:hypothetical protein
MPNPVVRLFRLLRLSAVVFVTALLAQWPISAAGADERADLHAALALAGAQYQVVLKTLETRGREETAAEVSRLREAFHAVMEHFDANRSALGLDPDYAGMLMQLDVSIVGVLLVIDFGSREAARDALAPIGQSLAELGARVTLRERLK